MFRLAKKLMLIKNKIENGEEDIKEQNDGRGDKNGRINGREKDKKLIINTCL